MAPTSEEILASWGFKPMTANEINKFWIPMNTNLPAKKSPSPKKSPPKKTPSPSPRLNKAKTLLKAFFTRKRGDAFVNKNSGGMYGLTKPSLVWSSVTTKTGSPIKLEDCVKIVNVLDKYATTSIEGYQTIGKKPYFRATWGTAAVGKINSTVSYVKINLVMLEPYQQATVLIFKTGSVQIGTNGQWERIARFIGREYLTGNTLKLIENAKPASKVCRFFCNKRIDIKEIAKYLTTKEHPGVRLAVLDIAMREESTVKNPAWKYGLAAPPVSMNNVGYVKTKIGLEFPGYKTRLNVFENGTVMGWGEPSNCVSSFKLLASAMLLRHVDLFSIGTVMQPPEKWNDERRKQAMINKRNPLAESWNSKRNGYYVRPGADGKKRFYPIPADPKLVRPKVIKAYANAKVAIPAHVKSVLGITNNATVKAKSPSKNRPTGFNNQSRNGYYVEPNKQGKPKWYKLQKESGRARAKPGVLNAYAKHFIPVPQHIKNLFKITNENIKKASERSKLPTFRLSPGGTLRIDEKQINRFNKNVLLQIARNMNIPSITEKNSKEEIKQVFIYKLKLKPQNTPPTKAELKFANNLEKAMLKAQAQNKNKANNK